jgi:rhodanese-related sulfurtransferase
MPARLIGVPHGPALIDVRVKEDFAADPRFIPGVVRRPYETVSSWAPEFARRSAVVICERGQKLSEGVAAWLRHAGSPSAEVLAGGHAAWAQAGLPLVPEGKLPPRDPQGRTVWVTRSRPKIDRIACPWLIRRFVDPEAVFLFVSPPEVQSVAERFNGAPFDIEGVFWSHRGEFCTFDTMLDELWASKRTARPARGNRQRGRHGAPRSCSRSSRPPRCIARTFADAPRRSRAACGGHDAL